MRCRAGHCPALHFLQRACLCVFLDQFSFFEIQRNVSVKCFVVLCFMENV